MASLKPRVLADGTTVYRVEWRMGKGAPDAGEKKVETFNPAKSAHRDFGAANAFRKALEANGHVWPANYVPGLGFVDARTMAEYRRAEHEAAQPQPVLFADFADKWLGKIGSGVEDGTLSRYRRILDRHLLPAFGTMDITDPEQISPETIGAWMLRARRGEPDEDAEPAPDGQVPWLREPLAPKTIRNLHGVLFAVMQSAVERERPLRERNPCLESGKHLPQLDDGEGDEEMVFLTPEEYQMIRWEIEDDAARDLTDFAVGTGLRFSEGTALFASDFELNPPKGVRPGFRVWRAWKQAGNGSYYLGAPKTAAAKRRISLDDEQVEMVGPYVAAHKDRKEPIFQGPNGGRWTHSTYYTGRWRPAVYRATRCIGCRTVDYAAGIGRRGQNDLTSEHLVWCGHEGQLPKVPRPHDLRHSHVAWLIGAGVPMLAISRRLGHKSIQITQDRYGHLLPEVDDALLEGLAALMQRATAGPVAALRI